VLARVRVLSLVVVAIVLTLGCAIGDRNPGCARDTDCAAGYVCRAAACMRLTTPVPAPSANTGSGGAGGH
jgi:hypothetical protein